MELFFWINEDKTITVHTQAESGDGDTGCCFEVLKPGESFMGVTYDQFAADGSGKMEVL